MLPAEACARLLIQLPTSLPARCFTSALFHFDTSLKALARVDSKAAAIKIKYKKSIRTLVHDAGWRFGDAVSIRSRPPGRPDLGIAVVIRTCPGSDSAGL